MESSKKSKKPDTADVKGSKDGVNIQKLDGILKSFLIDPKENLKPPQKAWYILGEGKLKREEYILGTLGNFSLIIGKAKSKKSFLINIAVSSVISSKPIFNKFGSSLPENQRTVLYFDTEQSKYHVQLALKRIREQTGLDEPENLKVYGLRSLPPSERLELIEHAINTIPNIGMVIIDGIKDLVTSINNEDQATMISSKLLKWTEEKNIHIICVLHQNKSDNNARGHIGTELINKAETVLSVSVDEKDREISRMEPVMTRNKEPLPFAFKINHRGLPVEVEGYSFTNEVQNKQRSILDTLDEFQKFDILEEVFKQCDNQSITYSELVNQVKLAVENLYKDRIGDNKAKTFITSCKNQGYLTQVGQKKPYLLAERPNSLHREDLENVPF